MRGAHAFQLILPAAIALAGLVLICQALFAAVARRQWTATTRGRILQGMGAITWVWPPLFLPVAPRRVGEAFSTAGVVLILSGVAFVLWGRRHGRPVPGGGADHQHAAPRP